MLHSKKACLYQLKIAVFIGENGLPAAMEWPWGGLGMALAWPSKGYIPPAYPGHRKAIDRPLE